MNTSWNATWTTLLGTLCLALTANAQPARTLTVAVFDYAGLSDNSMSNVENLSSAILSSSGIRTQWVHCLGHPQSPRPALCDGNSEAGSILIRIMKVHVGNPNKLGDPLGSAVVGSGYASVYVSEIRKFADHNGLPAEDLLAYAATHEIGHLLLGESHSPAGIMQAAWGKKQYRDMAQHWLGFSASERQALSQAVPAQGQTQASESVHPPAE